MVERSLKLSEIAVASFDEIPSPIQKEAIQVILAGSKDEKALSTATRNMSRKAHSDYLVHTFPDEELHEPVKGLFNAFTQLHRMISGQSDYNSNNAISLLKETSEYAQSFKRITEEVKVKKAQAKEEASKQQTESIITALKEVKESIDSLQTQFDARFTKIEEALKLNNKHSE